MQTYTSANTSLHQIARIYKNPASAKIIAKKFVIDIGGGKYDDASNYAFDELDAYVHVYDKFNRNEDNNEYVLSFDNYDVAIVSNVLNVIDDYDERISVLKLAKEKAKQTLISVYEGDRSGVGKMSKKDCYQLNRKLGDYMDEVKTVFENAEKHGEFILAW